MTEPLVSEVVDKHGRHHFAATASKFVRDGLEDGSLSKVEEAADGSEASADGDDHNAAGSGSGSGDRPGNDPAATREKRAGKAQSEARS